MLRLLPEPIKAPLRNTRDIVRWYLNGKPTPPPGIVKRKILRSLQKATGTPVFVETGTFMGDTTNAMLPYFKELHTIELSVDLYKRAQERFKEQTKVHYYHGSNGETLQSRAKVNLYQGDSGEVLKTVVASLTQPALFWLDGHYSEGITAKGALNTPIIKEIETIGSHSLANKHIIVIDDAREFVGKDDYPTEAVLKEFLAQKGFAWFKQISDLYVASATPINLTWPANA